MKQYELGKKFPVSSNLLSIDYNMYALQKKIGKGSSKFLWCNFNEWTIENVLVDTNLQKNLCTINKLLLHNISALCYNHVFN